MKAIHLQRMLALVFLLLGSWCLCFPGTVETLVLRPEFYIGNRTSHLLIGCFGAQAMLVGTVTWLSRFSANTFLLFGLMASVPFFIFNFYFYFVAEMFTDWMLLDFLGNLAILACGLLGYRILRRDSVEEAGG